MLIDRLFLYCERRTAEQSLIFRLSIHFLVKSQQEKAIERQMEADKRREQLQETLKCVRVCDPVLGVHVVVCHTGSCVCV